MQQDRGHLTAVYCTSATTRNPRHSFGAADYLEANSERGVALRSANPVIASWAESLATAINRKTLTTQLGIAPTLALIDWADHDDGRISVLQSLIVGSVFLIGAYGMYGDAWVGTWKEITTLFLMAFGVDLTAEGVVAVLRR